MAKHSVYAASKVFGEEKFHVVLLFLSSRDNVDIILGLEPQEAEKKKETER